MHPKPYFSKDHAPKYCPVCGEPTTIQKIHDGYDMETGKPKTKEFVVCSEKGMKHLKSYLVTSAPINQE